AVDDVAAPRYFGIGVLLLAEDGERVADRRERVAQLVRQHRHEVVLATVGLAQRLLAGLAVVDVAHHRHPALGTPAFAAPPLPPPPQPSARPPSPKVGSATTCTQRLPSARYCESRSYWTRCPASSSFARGSMSRIASSPSTWASVRPMISAGRRPTHSA